VEVEKLINNINSTNAMNYSSVQRTFNLTPAIPTNIDLGELDTQRKIMNKIMINYIEQVRSDSKRYVKERSAMDRLVDRSPFEANGDMGVNVFKAPIMYKDKWKSFSKTFLAGLDFDFLMLYSCVISFVEQVSRRDDRIQSALIIGVLTAYVLDCWLVSIRKYYGKRNLSENTLVDEAFLV
jgi:hypothetical protein